MKLVQTKDYLLLIDQKAEIEEWDFYYDSESKLVPIKQSIERFQQRKPQQYQIKTVSIGCIKTITGM